MSDADRKKWNERYAQGAYAQRSQPSDFLRSQIEHLPGGTAADLGCGRGRNAVFLARHGYRVDAYDISSVGLALAAQPLEHAASGESAHPSMERAEISSADVSWIERDLLAEGLPARAQYDLIIMFRFVAMDLLGQLHSHVNPGGHILVEQHLRVPGSDSAQFSGPANPAYRVAPGALAESLAGCSGVMYQFEGVVEEPDGTAAALARILVQV